MKTPLKRLRLTASAFLVGIALALLDVGAVPYDNPFGIVSMLLSGAIVLASVCVAFRALMTRRWGHLAYSGVAILTVVTSLLVSRSVSHRQRAGSIAAAQPVLAAIERFRTERGAYPETIHQLVPAYLPVEPRTRMGFNGTPFHLRSKPGKLTLYFDLPAAMRCSYDSDSKQWHVHD